MALQDKLSTALLTDPGLVRSNNEDTVAEDVDIGLLVLADGMGGYNAGEVASGIAVTTVIDAVRRQWPTLTHGSVDPARGYRPDDRRGGKGGGSPVRSRGGPEP